MAVFVGAVTTSQSKSLTHTQEVRKQAATITSFKSISITVIDRSHSLSSKEGKKKPTSAFFFSFCSQLLKALIPRGFSDLNYFLHPSDLCHLIPSSLTENLMFISQSL